MANEQRLISVDANKLEELLSECFDVVKCIKSTELSLMHALLVWKGICKQPTVDAVEVVHGRWLKTQEPLGWRDVDCVECSNCHDSWVIDEDYEFDDFGGWNYCPNCGAKMDGGNEDENKP